MPRITEITAHAGATFNNPYESYSNFRPGISLKAEVLEGEDPDWAAVALQARAHELLKAQTEEILAGLKKEHDARWNRPEEDHHDVEEDDDDEDDTD